MEMEVVEAGLSRAAATAKFIQGEVLAAADACIVLADAKAPLSPEALEVAGREEGSSGLIVVPYPVECVVLLTQTCDLQVTSADEHCCLVAPMMHVTREIAHQALRGRRPALAALPWVNDTAVADLSRITTVERSILVRVDSLGHPRSPEERFRFSETLARYLTRPALPDPINEVLSPFVSRLKEKHDRRSVEGRCAYLVSELRVEAAPDLDAPEPALNVLMILDEEHLPMLPRGGIVDHERIDELRRAGRERAAEAALAAAGPVSAREAWTALAECWIEPSVDQAPTVPGVGSVEITVLNGEELSYARSLNAPVLDLRYLSTRAAAS